MFRCDNSLPAIRPASKSSAVGRCERRGVSPVIAVPAWRRLRSIRFGVTVAISGWGRGLTVGCSGR
eukprot:6885708-Alexandrium_andersonii.AAC.1